MWVYHSSIGDISIKRLRNGMYGIEFDGELSGNYRSPEAAADDVYCHATGCYKWDMYDDPMDCPSDLSEWDTL